MGYAVEADVRRNLGQYAPGWPRADGSPPTLADGIAFADHASGEIDAILSSHGLVTPVAAPASFVAKLTDLAALYAASLVAAGLFPQAAGPASAIMGPRRGNDRPRAARTPAASVQSPRLGPVRGVQPAIASAPAATAARMTRRSLTASGR